MHKDLIDKQKAISVTGLGYVGLPLALAFAKKFRVVGFDISEARVALMRQGIDPSNELDAEDFSDTDIFFTTEPDDLEQAHFHVIAVPTPVDEHKVPNLSPLLRASETVGKRLKKGDIVVFESTVYPGCTEEDCLPILENESGLRCNEDFFIGYSPERINPGDKEHTLTKILKIVSGSNDEAKKIISEIYGSIIEAGIHEAPTIKVAEAAKVIENTQRDLNIALMNELSIIFDQMDIDTKAVLKAAGTKWNFLRFSPGLVGGHCIGVDPYYLTYKSRKLGYAPQVILSGRSINDEMPSYIAKRLVQTLIKAGKNPNEAIVLVLGITFKENVSDIRNSKVADLVRELKNYSVTVDVADPHAAAEEVEEAYGLQLTTDLKSDYDAVIVAVGHDVYRELPLSYFENLMGDTPVLFDLKGIYAFDDHLNGMMFWRM